MEIAAQKLHKKATNPNISNFKLLEKDEGILHYTGIWTRNKKEIWKPSSREYCSMILAGPKKDPRNLLIYGGIIDSNSSSFLSYDFNECSWNDLEKFKEHFVINRYDHLAVKLGWGLK